MSWRIVCASLLAAVAWILLAGAAWAGEPVILEPGQAAPERGIFLTDELQRRLNEVLRDGETAKAVVETLKAAVAAKDEEIAGLKRELAEREGEAHKREIALAKAEERDRLRAEMDAKLEARVKELMELLREERAARKWERILGAVPFVGAVLLLLGVGGL